MIPSWNRRRLIGAGAVAAGLPLWNPEWVLAAVRPPAAPRTARTLNVGPSRSIKSLAAAAASARDGDLVLIDPGDYRRDVAAWSQNDIVLRANGGRVRILADGASAEDKGTFVVRGTDVEVEGIEFRGARSRDRNGAGIRMEPRSRVKVTRCRFEDNENGILTANDPSGELELIDSEFVQNGAGDGQSHNVYVGTIASLRVSGCYFARASVGHLLKSRARESYISYSRLSGEEGTSSYELEFPSGGRAIVIGCLIQQGPKTENSTIVSCGSEGYRWQQNELLISFCTIINERPGGGTFVNAAAGLSRVELVDNILVGAARMDLRVAHATVRNSEGKRVDFADAAQFDYRLRRSSALVGAAGMAGKLGEGRVSPDREYLHPAGSVALERFTGLTPLSPGAFQRIAP
jgi:hypothetical protein